MQHAAVTLFATVLALIGAAPKDTPTKSQIKPGQQIVAIGDSITQAGGYLKMIDAVLAENAVRGAKLPPIINVGISGQKAEDLVARFANDVVGKKPAFVTLSIGINDVWHRLGQPHDENVLAEYKKNVTKMVEMAQAANIKVILLTPTLINEDAANEGNARLKLYVQAMKDIATAKECQVADLHQMFLNALEKKPAGTPEHWITSDGVHMNDQGDAIMAIGVLRALGLSDQRIAASHWPAVKK